MEPENAGWPRQRRRMRRRARLANRRAKHDSSRLSALRRRSVEAQASRSQRPRRGAGSACARRMKGRRGNEARRDHDVALPRRRLVRVARFERAVVFADARARRRGDTPHPAARHASFVHSWCRVVGVRRSGVDRRLDGGRRFRETPRPVRRKSGAGDADAEPERCQERRERAQLAEWFPPPTSWCGSVTACAHTAMLSAPLRPIKHRTEGAAHASSTSSPPALRGSRRFS